MENGRYSLLSDNESSSAARGQSERRRINWGSLASAQRTQAHASGRSSWPGARLSKAEKAGVLGMVAVVFLIAGLVITSGGGDSESNALNPASDASKVKWALDLKNSPENVTPLPEPAAKGADREKELDKLFNAKFAAGKRMDPKPPEPQGGAIKKTAMPGRSTDTGAKKNKKPPAGKKESFRTYVVKKNDMLGTISQRLLGTCKRWKEIKALNPKIDENNLKPGTKIRIPAR